MTMHARVLAAAAFVACAPLAGRAQQPSASDTLSIIQTSVACAPSPPAAAGTNALHVIGAQDTVARTVFSERDLLVIDGGTARDVQLGQRYFVRRPAKATAYGRAPAHSVQTAGWIRIIAANDTTAIALVDHACGPIEWGDELEPFVAPSVPGDLETIDRSGEPDFKTLGRVLGGDENRAAAGPGDYMVIDQGSDQGVAAGARFAVYRDVVLWMRDARGVRAARLPLAAIGEGVVVSTSASTSVMRIVAVRDAVQTGDFVVPRRK